MDEMIIKTGFMRGLIAKLMKRTIHKRLGHDVDVLINEIAFTNSDKATFHIDMDLTISRDELTNLVKELLSKTES